MASRCHKRTWRIEIKFETRRKEGVANRDREKDVVPRCVLRKKLVAENRIPEVIR